jgi:hypothetical protein
MFGKLKFHNLNYIQRVSEISALILTDNSGIMTPLLNLITTLAKGPIYLNTYIFSLNLEVIQLKLWKDLAQISLPAYGYYLLRR